MSPSWFRFLDVNLETWSAATLVQRSELITERIPPKGLRWLPDYFQDSLPFSFSNSSIFVSELQGKLVCRPELSDAVPQVDAAWAQLPTYYLFLFASDTYLLWN